MTREIFRYQIWHVVSVIALIASIQLFIVKNEIVMNGTFWDIGTKTWFWLAISVPILHQISVWLIWRLELYQKTFTSRYGLTSVFKIYSVGFTILFSSRMVFIIILATCSKNTLSLKPIIAYLIAGSITPIIIYLFYSVLKYFTLERAFGIDHFHKNDNDPFVKRGIFRYTNNGMYIYGFMFFYLPGLLLLSKPALIVALFNHIYIWVHYFCTERPDMKSIYGKTPVN